MKLIILIGTTRIGRQTEKVAKWALAEASKIKDIQAEIIDLVDYPMPFFDEPVSPRFNPKRQLNPVVKKWLDKIKEFDAYLVVTPEYNHSIPGVLKNALDYIDFQTAKKPFAIISHGSSGGARGAEHLKAIISEIVSVVIPSAVAITLRVSEVFDDNGTLVEEISSKSYGPHIALNHVLAELKWYSDALSAARNKV